MPLLRYFVFVGGTLLGLLLACNAIWTPQPLPSELSVQAADDPGIRIRSDRKWPERIVFDTDMPAIVPSVVAAQAQEVAPASGAVDVARETRTREALAQMVPTRAEPVHAKPAEPRHRHKRKVAKPRPVTPPYMQLAQQPPRFVPFSLTW